MKIIFLGTGHGVPSDERYCQSILAEQGQNAYLIDAGAPIIDILLRMHYDITRIKAIFITHMHGDHFDGLARFTELCSWYFKNTAFEVFFPEKSGIEYINNMFDTQKSEMDDKRIKLHTYSAGEVYRDENIKITAHPTEHCRRTEQSAYGFMLEGGSARIYITGDMIHNLEDFPRDIAAQPLDAFITECAHFSAEALFEKLENCRAKRVMAIHTFPLDKYEKFDRLKLNKPFEFIAPKDGESYLFQ